MPKHCSGIGINLFVQSKERNLFINVYFGAGSSLGCYKICIDRSSACIHFVWGHTQLDIQNGLRFIIEGCMPISVRRIIFFCGLVSCYHLFDISSFYYPPFNTTAPTPVYCRPPYSFRCFWDINFSFILFKFIFLGNLDIFSLEDQKLRHMKYRYLNNI